MTRRADTKCLRD